jgi:hypothetical protein
MTANSLLQLQEQALDRSRFGPSRTISDARAALAIADTVEVTVDVVEAALMVEVAESSTGEPLSVTAIILVI